MIDSLIPIDRLVEHIPYSRASIYRLVKTGKFPAPVSLSRGPGGRNGKVAWRESEVYSWMAARPELRAPVPKRDLLDELL